MSTLKLTMTDLSHFWIQCYYNHQIILILFHEIYHIITSPRSYCNTRLPASASAATSSSASTSTTTPSSTQTISATTSLSSSTSCPISSCILTSLLVHSRRQVFKTLGQQLKFSLPMLCFLVFCSHKINFLLSVSRIHFLPCHLLNNSL